MDVSARRREARRRRLLQDPEERLRRIRDLKSRTDSPKPNEGISDTPQPSSSAEEVTHLPQGEEVTAGLEETDRDHHLCSQPAMVHHRSPPPDTHEPPELERISPTPPHQKNSSGDLSSSIQNFFFSQLLLFSGQHSQSSNLTSVVCLVAVLFRISLEVEWLTPYTGKSLVIIFAVVYLPLIIMVRKPKNAMSVAVLVFGVIQDFALYLFMFIITHELISAFT